MDSHGNEDFWQVLCGRTLVTERAVGEEAYYVFVSISLLNGNFFIKNIIKFTYIIFKASLVSCAMLKTDYCNVGEIRE